MNVQFELSMYQITLNKEKSHYNHLHWDLRNNKLGVTHIIEVYDDVDEHNAMYEIYRGEEYWALGEGVGIDQNKVGWGGCEIIIHIFGAEDLFK